MKYTPTTLGQDKLASLEAPYLGGEFLVFMTHKPVKEIAQIDFTAVGTATLTDNAATSITTGGKNLQIVTSKPFYSPGGNSVITLAVTDSADASVAATATLSPPAWAANQSSSFGVGFGKDLVAAGGDNPIKTIASLTSVTYGSEGAQLKIVELPELADYVQIGCIRGVSWNDRTPKSIGIDCGMISDAFVKAGKSMPGDLKISHKLKGWADGLARFGGHQATLMLVGVKDGLVMADRIVFANFRAGPRFDLPEGEGEATAEADGKFTDAFYFVAGYSV